MIPKAQLSRGMIPKFVIFFSEISSVQWRTQLSKRVENMRLETERRARIEASKRQWTAAPEINEPTSSSICLTNPMFRTTTATTTTTTTTMEDVEAANQICQVAAAATTTTTTANLEAGTSLERSTSCASSASSSVTLKVIIWLFFRNALVFYFFTSTAQPCKNFF